MSCSFNIYSGWLNKKAEGIFSNWKKKYFVLNFDGKEGKLSYAEKEKGEKLVEVSVQEIIEVKWLKENNSAAVGQKFNIIMQNNKIWELHAQAMGDMIHWLKYIALIKTGQIRTPEDRNKLTSAPFREHYIFNSVDDFTLLESADAPKPPVPATKEPPPQNAGFNPFGAPRQDGPGPAPYGQPSPYPPPSSQPYPPYTSQQYPPQYPSTSQYPPSTQPQYPPQYPSQNYPPTSSPTYLQQTYLPQRYNNQPSYQNPPPGYLQQAYQPQPQPTVSTNPHNPFNDTKAATGNVQTQPVAKPRSTEEPLRNNPSAPAPATQAAAPRGPLSFFSSTPAPAPAPASSTPATASNPPQKPITPRASASTPQNPEPQIPPQGEHPTVSPTYPFQYTVSSVPNPKAKDEGLFAKVWEKGLEVIGKAPVVAAVVPATAVAPPEPAPSVTTNPATMKAPAPQTTQPHPSQPSPAPASPIPNPLESLPALKLNTKREKVTHFQSYVCEEPELRTWKTVVHRNMQLGALVGWINYQLSSANHSISDINALGDGVTIVKLVEALLFESPPNVISPISTSKDKLDNLSSAINLFNSKTGADIGVSPLILTGNLKALMDLAWDIIYHSSIKTIYYGGFPDRFALLKWAQDNTAHLNIPLINDFVTSFKSGMAFCALISSIHPGLVYLDDLQEYKVMDNLRLAFKLANEVFKVPKLIEPADMLSDPDEITIIIYLSLCYQKFV